MRVVPHPKWCISKVSGGNPDVIWSAHHAAWEFNDATKGIDFRSRSALTDPLQMQKLSDYGTDVTVPTNGILTVRSLVNRAMGDINRQRDNAFREKDFGKVFVKGQWQDDKHPIWKAGMEPSDAEKEMLLQTYWDPYNARILDVLRASTRPVVVVAFDNTADYKIGVNPDGSDRTMMNLDLANDGARNQADVDDRGRALNVVTTCDPAFLNEFAYQLSRALGKQDLCPDVTINKYDDEEFDQCGELARRFSTRRSAKLDVSVPVHSFQVEYSTRITHPRQDTELVGDPDRMNRLRIAHEQAMHATYTNLLTHNVHVIRKTDLDSLSS